MKKLFHGKAPDNVKSSVKVKKDKKIKKVQEVKIKHENSKQKSAFTTTFFRFLNGSLNTLKKKIIAGFLVTTFLSCLVIFFILTFTAQKIFTQQMVSQSQSMADQVTNSIDQYGIEETSNIEQIVKNFKISKDGLQYISVENSNHMVMGNIDKTTLGTKIPNNDLDEVIKTKTTFHETDGDVLTVVTPIMQDSKVVGGVTVKMSLSQMDSAINKMRLIGAIVSLLIFILCGAFGWIVANYITKPFGKMMNTINKVSEGDFTVRAEVNSKDEVGKLSETINNTIEVIKSMVGGIKDTTLNLEGISKQLSSSSEQVADSSQMVAGTVQEMAKGASNQATDLSDVVNMMDGFTASLDSIQSELNGVTESSTSIRTTAETSSSKIEELIKSINDVRDTFTYVTKRLSSLNESVKQITSITDVINSVAEQTNLLALNAAIEAARAGDVGRGFSVVANEIKKLAEQVLQSSKGISKLVATIMSETKEVSSSAEAVSGKMENQMTEVNVAVTSLKTITDVVETIVPEIQDVYKALEGSIGIKDNVITKLQSVAGVSEEVSASSQQVSAAVEEQAAETQELTSQAQKLLSMSEGLQSSVDKYKV